MSESWVADVLFWIFAAGSVVSAVLVFRVDSMVRAAFWLLASFACVGVILVLLDLQFLGFILILMMAGEMAIMAMFMVMFMMNPAGLNPMFMVHQHRLSLTAGAVSFLGLGVVAVFGVFPSAERTRVGDITGELGTELLGGSMLVFQTAGVALLATMIGALAIAGSRGRFGPADEGSVEPTRGPEEPTRGPEKPTRGPEEPTRGPEEPDAGAMADVGVTPDDDDEHEGHGGHGGHG